MFSFTETKAAEYAAAMVKRSDRTVRRWQSGLIDNDGVLPESQEGRYQRTGVLWYNEELNKKAAEYVRENASVKVATTLQLLSFVSGLMCASFLTPHLSLVFHVKLVSRHLVNGYSILALRF